MSRALRRELAAALGELVWRDSAIVDMVRSTATNLSIADIELLGPAGLTWERILAQLEDRHDHAAIAALIAHGRTLSRRVPWQRFDPLGAPAVPMLESVGPALAAETTWSHVTLQLHSDDDAVRSIALGAGQALLAARATMRWDGRQPPDPVFRIEMSSPFGLRAPLRVTWKKVGDVDGIASWSADFVVPAVHLRTRQVTATCAAQDQTVVERHTIVSPLGATIAFVAWIALAIVAYYWLAPIVPGWITAVVAAGGGSSAVWSLSSLRLRRPRGGASWLERSFNVWERALPIVALGLTAVVIVPTLTLVEVVNDTGRDVELGRAGYRNRESRWVRAPDAPRAGQLPAPYCVCGSERGCRCKGAVGETSRWIPRLVVGCRDGNCEPPPEPSIEVRGPGGAIEAMITPGPNNLPRRPLSVAPGTFARLLMVTIDGEGNCAQLIATAERKAPSANALEFEVAPEAVTQPFSVEIDGLGRLTCPPGADRIVTVPIDHGERRRAAAVTFTIGAGPSSTWTWLGDAQADAHVCLVVGAPSDLKGITVSFADGGTVTCEGGPVKGLRSLPHSPPATKLDVKVGELTSHWSADSSRVRARVCGDQRVPFRLLGPVSERRFDVAELDASELWIGDVRLARCADPHTLRIVRYKGAALGSATSDAFVAVAPGLYATCEPLGAYTLGGNRCELRDSQLQCSATPPRPYRGPCTYYPSDDALRHEKGCDNAATGADFKAAKKLEGTAQCSKIYSCT